MWRSTQVSWLPAAYFPCPTWENTAQIGFSLLCLLFFFSGSSPSLLSFFFFFSLSFWFSWGYAKKPDNLGACSLQESSAESEWVAGSLQRQPPSTPKKKKRNLLVHNVAVWAERKEWMNEWSVPGLWSWAGWCPPLARESTWHWCVCVCTCVCVKEKRVSAIEETGRVHSAV